MTPSVIPAKAGIHFSFFDSNSTWIPAFAGMTNFSYFCDENAT